MSIRLVLSPEQCRAVEPPLQPGRVLIGRVMREPFDGTNAEVSGRLVLECGAVPLASLPALRAAIAKATKREAKH